MEELDMDDLNLPHQFIQNIENAFGADGARFIEHLPGLIDAASQRWGLADIRSVPNPSYNFVAYARRDRENVMLKIGVPNPELSSEMAALELFNGDGACRLLERDAESGSMLLERLHPGTMLADLSDDDERTHIAVDVMQKVRRPLETPGIQTGKFIQLSHWFESLKNIRPRFNGGTGPFQKRVLERVESCLPELLADGNIKLIHGDLHHFNILLSGRGWLAIDPKGVIGPAGYEVGPLMLNPWGGISDGALFKARTLRRTAILAEGLSLERGTILNWAAAHAVLSAWWDLLPDGTGGEYALWCAELFSGLG